MRRRRWASAHRPPLTPLTSADTMRSVHTWDSIPDTSRASAPCLALADTSGAGDCSGMLFPHPPSCPAFPRPGFASRTSRGSRRRGTMRTLTPAGFAHSRQVSPLTPPAFRASRPQPRDAPRTSLSQSPQRVRSGPKGPSASPIPRGLTGAPRRNRFVILRATRLPPVASHPASRRRSYSQLRVA